MGFSMGCKKLFNLRVKLVTIILTSFFITFISKGMVEVRKTFMFTNDSISNIVVGIVYFAVIICSFFINYKLVFRKKEKEEIKK